MKKKRGDGSFGRRVRSLRNKIGYSQERLAHEVGTSLNQIYKIERGKNEYTRCETVKRMALIFKVSIDFLLGLEKLPMSRRHREARDVLLFKIQMDKMTQGFSNLRKLAKKILG